MTEWIDNEKTHAEIEWDPKLNLYHRGPGDLGIVAEQHPCYGKFIQLVKEGDFILNLGAHIGLFDWYARNHSKPGMIYSVEPDPNNLRVLEKNTNSLTHIIPGAVIDDSSKSELTLYLGKTYPATNSVHPFRGRKEVKVSSIQWKYLLSLDPDIIKCDIEGAEYLLDWNLVPDCVRAIALELHFFRAEWEQDFNDLNEVLLGKGFTVIKVPKYNSYSKVTIGIYAR